jgi:hypothetical protein
VESGTRKKSDCANAFVAPFMRTLWPIKIAQLRRQGASKPPPSNTATPEALGKIGLVKTAHWLCSGTGRLLEEAKTTAGCTANEKSSIPLHCNIVFRGRVNVIAGITRLLKS